MVGPAVLTFVKELGEFYGTGDHPQIFGFIDSLEAVDIASPGLEFLEGTHFWEGHPALQAARRRRARDLLPRRRRRRRQRRRRLRPEGRLDLRATCSRCWETLFVIKAAMEAADYQGPDDRQAFVEAIEAMTDMPAEPRAPAGRQGLQRQDPPGLRPPAHLARSRAASSPSSTPPRSRTASTPTRWTTRPCPSDALDFGPFLLLATLEGLVMAAVLALTAVGLSLVFGVMRVVNVAHGEFFMLGAVVAWFVAEARPRRARRSASSPRSSSARSSPRCIAVALDRLVLRRLDYEPEAVIVATIGLGYVLQQGALSLYGPEARAGRRPFDLSLQFPWFGYSGYKLAVIAAAAPAPRRRLAAPRRAPASASSCARPSGTARPPPPSASTSTGSTPLVFGLGAGLAAIAAVLIVPIQQAHYLMGGDPLLLSFIVVIIGGLGCLRGTVVAALLIGLSDGIVSVFFSPTLAKILATLLVALVLVFRPQGLFGRRSAPAAQRRAACAGRPAAPPRRCVAVPGGRRERAAVLACPRRARASPRPCCRPTTRPTSPGSWCSRSSPWATTSPSATRACSASATRSSSPPASTPPASSSRRPALAGRRRASPPAPPPAAALAAAVGLLALRTTGIAFMIVTLMFAQAGYLAILYFGAWTRGDEGFTIARAARTLGPLDLSADGPRYAVAFALFAVGLLASLALVRAPDRPRPRRRSARTPSAPACSATTRSATACSPSPSPASTPAPPAPPTACSSAMSAPPSPRSSIRSCRCSGCCSAAPAPCSGRCVGTALMFYLVDLAAARHRRHPARRRRRAARPRALRPARPARRAPRRRPCRGCRDPARGPRPHPHLRRPAAPSRASTSTSPPARSTR